MRSPTVDADELPVRHIFPAADTTRTPHGRRQEIVVCPLVEVGSIGRGVCVFVGISKDDNDDDIEYIVRKILNVRLFESDNKRWDKSVKDEGLEVLCVSQFTLYGFLKGNKLDFHNSMNPQDASLFYGRFMDKLRSSYLPENIQSCYNNQ
ncbi:unnamed protein product [Nippostrongylus brasiliensis]|uniref:D-aminoacyl-tRNA deacylase n=1 Tax=Nippostrongylus brasiliensis TaxID=27835 RepID=A0A0N4Y8G6_NIPBR|nr:unnamed protein product [Nippostrongylus brasiliensis]